MRFIYTNQSPSKDLPCRANSTIIYQINKFQIDISSHSVSTMFIIFLFVAIVVHDSIDWLLFYYPSIKGRPFAVIVFDSTQKIHISLQMDAFINCNLQENSLLEMLRPYF